MNSSRMSIARYWVPAGAALICLGLGMGIMSVFGFFIDPLAEEFAVSRATITTAPVILILVPAFFGPFVGRIADKLPIRVVMMIGLCISTGSLYLISLAPSLLYAAIGFAVFVIGMSLCGPIVINALLVKIYQNDSGRALAIAAMGASFAGMTLPKWVAFLLEDGTWRDALSALAIAIFMLLAVVIFFAIPRTATPLQKPSQKSIAKDALNNISAPEQTIDNSDLETKTTSDSSADKPFLRTTAFWLVGIGVAMTFNAALVLGICYPPHLLGLGFSLDQAASIIAMGGVGGIIGKICVASLADKFQQQIKYLVAVIILIKLGAVIGLMSISSFYPLLIVALFLGAGGGAFIPMHPILNSCYFDRSIVGQVNGAQMPLFLPFALLGAPMAGLAYDVSGHYYWVLLAVISVLFLALMLLLFLPKPPLASKETSSTEQGTERGEAVAG